MKRTNTTQLENAVWANFNTAVLTAASAHLPHDTAAYERARAIAQHRAEQLVTNIRAAARDANEREHERARNFWRQPKSLIPFESDLS